MAEIKRKLTENQQRFLDVLFEEAEGNLKVARDLAGYGPTTPVTQIVDSLQDEIYELTKKFISRSGTKAAWAVSDLIDRPTTPGAREKLAAAKDLLDRGGFKPADKVELETDSPLFILPEKAE